MLVKAQYTDETRPTTPATTFSYKQTLPQTMSSLSAANKQSSISESKKAFLMRLMAQRRDSQQTNNTNRSISDRNSGHAEFNTSDPVSPILTQTPQLTLSVTTEILPQPSKESIRTSSLGKERTWNQSKKKRKLKNRTSSDLSTLALKPPTTTPVAVTTTLPNDRKAFFMSMLARKRATQATQTTVSDLPATGPPSTPTEPRLDALDKKDFLRKMINKKKSDFGFRKRRRRRGTKLRFTPFNGNINGDKIDLFRQFLVEISKKFNQYKSNRGPLNTHSPTQYPPN